MPASNGRENLREREKASQQSQSPDSVLPTHHHHTMDVPSPPRGSLVPIRPAGESGRNGIHPLKFFKLIWQSSSHLSTLANILWPFVPAALAVYWTIGPEWPRLTFSLVYVAMVPCANLIGYAGQELARKLPHVLGVLIETKLGSVVEIIMFMVLLKQGNMIYVIKAAILGSILATMLLCLGLCFFAAGLKREEATFNSTISEVGTGLLLISGLGLAIPTIFARSLQGEWPQEVINQKTLGLSRVIAVILLISYFVYVWFQMHTHHGIYEAVFEHDEHRDEDGHKEREKEKMTLTECVIALVVAVALVTLLAIALVRSIEGVVAHGVQYGGGVSDPFMGLILVPLVEKVAEHLTAIDEAWDNQINLALSHCIGGTIQTAMLNAPLVVLVAWGQGLPMSFGFEIFDIIMLILGILAVGNFLRDQKSDYLEGFLCVMTYVAFAVAAFYYPSPHHVVEEIQHHLTHTEG